MIRGLRFHHGFPGSLAQPPRLDLSVGGFGTAIGDLART
jgi:hypothetical protein